MIKELKPALVMLGLMTLLTGIVYPALVTGVAQTLFPRQANGSILEFQGRPVGSTLVGQPFSDPGVFWGRPSATAPVPYNAAASGGSNLGPRHPALEEAVKGRIAALEQSDPQQTRPIPVELVTASASGLDPHISPAAARWQLPRVARAQGLSEQALANLVARHTESRTFGVLGEPRVNVLTLNLDLKSMNSRHEP
ncbi:MAG: potassium-transporting ATPase subunit KdpC [Magnetococcales bacterium]|nr:potassium-transporting ATPase subunit KdpC [Magnetococcales bacterium]